MQLFKNANFNFMKYKYLAFVFSGIVIVAGIINISFGTGLKLGVDFSGGTLIRVKFKNPVPISDIRSALGDVKLGSSTIQELERGRREYQIRTVQSLGKAEQTEELEAHEAIANKVIETLRPEEDAAAVAGGLKDLNSVDQKELAFLLEPAFPDEAVSMAQAIISFRNDNGIIENLSQLESAGIKPEAITHLKDRTFLGSLSVLSRETVGPQVGKDLRTKATKATIWALIGMLIYIALRFKLAYGVSAIITLTHDVLITLSIYSFTNREINLPVVAAVLTIVGYSINDTIVIFDRVRDNLKIMRKTPFEGILNASINQTLSRSIITSGTVFLTVLALFIFGGEVINDFAFTMLVGVIEGSYSTIYQSCPIVLFWQKIFKPKKGFRK
jgi:preprotein translocase subunit SecF